MKKRWAKYLLSLTLPLLIILTAVGVFAANDNSKEVDMMDAILADGTLATYRVGETKTVDDGYIGIPVEVTTFFNPEKGAKAGYDVDATVLVVYVVNATFERIGTDSDVDIIKSMLERGYIVAVADYKNNPAAVSPKLDFSLQTLRGKLISGSFYGNSNVIPAGSYYNSFVIPSGYDVAPFHVFWEIDKHGVDGTLENIVEIWNNDFRGVKGETVIKWTDENGNRKATQNGFDGSSPEWLNERGSADENGEYIRIKHTLAERITDCVKKDGSPIDLNLYMHVMYPTGSVEVPVLALVGSSEHLSGGTATADRPQLIGAVLNGYAGIAFDHGYTPMARNDHYGYFDGNAAVGHVTGDNLTYSIQFYNSVEIGTAAMRYIRYLSLSEEKYAFDLDAIGTYGNSKGGWHQFLGEPDPYSTATRRIYPGHHGETRYEAGKTATDGVIDGGEPQPWMTFEGEEISPRSNFLYCSCGGTYDAISAGHSPTFITANLNDGSYYWTSNDFVNVCRSVDVPAMWFEVPLGHTFGWGDDMVYGVDVYEAFFHFAGYWLKGDPVSVEYINADMTYGGMPTHAPFTVKFTGTVTESELAGITLAAADGTPVGGFWTSAFGGTEWTYHPDYLASNTAYTLTVPAGIKGNNGIPSTEEYKYTVTTGYESVISGEGVTRVTGTRGDYYTVTVPAASSITEFNVNKYLLRVKVTNDAVNDLGIYAVNGFDPASPDASTVGARLATVNVNGAGYYDVDLTAVLSAAAGNEITLLVKQEKTAGTNPVFSAPNDTAISTGQTVSGSVEKGWESLDGNGVIKVGKFALTETYKNDLFYGNISIGGVVAVPGIIGNSALTYDDTGRRFVISLRVYDTVERYVGVFLNDCTSANTGVFDPYGSNYNFKTKANEWVTFSFTYDVYEPAEFGANGLQKKSLSIATYGFGEEVHPIYFDDITATEILTDVTVSECSLVLSTTEQRKNPLETPYGIIPDSYADAELYPFVVFDSTGKFLIATDVWATDNGGGAIGACAKQATVNNVIVLRRNYTYADSTSYNNFAFVYGNVKIDLMGNTLTLAHKHGKGMFYCHAKRSVGTNITIENGEILLGAELISIAGWNSGNYDFATLVKQFNFDFGGVKFTANGSSTHSLMVVGSSDAPVASNLNFNGCEFDFTGGIPSGYTFLNLGDNSGYVSAHATIIGGALLGGDLSSLKLAGILGKTSALYLDADENGEYLCQKINTGGALMPYSASIDGESHTYEQAGTDGEYTVYKLVANPLNTPYGEIDAAYADRDAYPFAVFFDFDGTYYFYNAVGNFFDDATFSELASLCSNLVVYMRRDFTVEQTLTEFGKITGGFSFTLDLGESTLTSTAGTAIALSAGDSNLTVKGGKIINGAHPFITVGGDGATDNITFNGVKITTSAAPVDFVAATSPVSACVTFVGTVIDMRGASTPLTVFAAGAKDGSVTATVNVNGGRVYLDSTSGVTLTDVRGTGSSVTFGRDGGSYTELRLPTGVGAPAYTVTTTGGITVGFSRLSTEDGNDVYIPSDLDTPYGRITATFASADSYPFAIFKLESDGTYTFVTAIADFFADGSVTAYWNFDTDVVVYMRRDFTVVSRFTNLRQIKRGVTLDLGGRTLTANSASQSFYVVNNGSRTGATEFYVRFKNGTILTDKTKTFLLFGSVTSTTASANFKVYFDNVTFVAPEGNTNAYPIIEHTNALTPFTAYVTFTDCTFDMTNASNTLRLFNLSNKDGTIVTHITVNGGEIILPSVAKYAMPYYYNDSTASSLTFGESDNGYAKIVLPTASAAPGHTVMTAGGEMAGFALVESTKEKDIYSLRPSITTAYGVIPPAYADATLYPFVVFRANGTFVGGYPCLFGSTDTSNGGDLSKIAMHAARGAGNGAVILMRTDWVYTDSVSYPNIGNNTGTVTVDLGGHTIYDRHTYTGGLFHMMAKPTTPGGANTLVVKNGSILIGGKNPLASFSAFNEEVDNVTLTLKFEGVKLGFEDGATTTKIIDRARPVLNLHYNVVFTDCEVDMVTNAPDGVKFYDAGSKDGALSLSASGLTFVGSTLTGKADLGLKHSVSLYNGFLYNLYIPARGGVGEIAIGGESVSPTSLGIVFMDGDVYYRVSRWVQPIGSLEKLPLTVALTLADGSTENAEWQVGVISYVTALIAGDDAAAATLGREMLAYIEAAYLFFAPDSLEAAEVSALVREQLGEDYNSANMPSTDVPAVQSTGGLDSAALLIGGTPKFVFYPATDDTGALLYSTDAYVFKIGDRTVSATASTDAEGRVYITLDTYAYEMTGTVSYTVTGTDLSGEYNLKAYLEYARTADPALLTLVERLWKYSEAALAYSNSVAN